MSYSVAARAKRKLNTKTVSIDVLGGGEDYTEDSYGFKNVNNGLKSSYAVSGEPTGQCDRDGMTRVLYMPGISAAVALTGTCYFNMITDAGVMSQSRNLNVITTPFVCYQIVNDLPAYVIFAGSKFAVLPNNTYSGTMLYTPDCGVIHDGRLFIASRNNNDYLRWSSFRFMYDKRGPDFTAGVDGGGRLTLTCELGKVMTLLNFRKDIVLVREYGITVVHAMGDSRHFTVDKTSYGFEGKASAYCGAVCADKVWFCTENNLYTFDGESVKKVELEKFMYSYTFKEMCGFRDTHLYINCRKGNVKYFAEFDVATGKCAVFGKGLNVQWRTNSGSLCISGRQIYALSDTEDDDLREWKSKKIDFGNALLKTLKRIKIDCDDGIEIFASAGGQTYRVLGGGEFALGLTGSEFDFRVKGTGAVRKLTAEWEVRR